MFCQRGSVATLVPPNFITIQGAWEGKAWETEAVTVSRRCWEKGIWHRRARGAPVSNQCCTAAS
jgi:hypothetical protein